MREQFVSWTIKNYKNSDCPIGDLARDIQEDKRINYFKIESYKGIKKRFLNCGGVSSCLNSLDNAYEIYKKNESYLKI